MRNSVGYTFLEIIIVLVIIGVLVVFLYGKTGEKKIDTAKLQTAASEMVEIYQACVFWKSKRGQDHFSGISISSLVSDGFWPRSTHSFDGNITIAADATNTRKVRITFSSVPSSATSQLVNLLSKRGVSAGSIGSDVYGDF